MDFYSGDSDQGGILGGDTDSADALMIHIRWPEKDMLEAKYPFKSMMS